ncbi:MAG: 30S ribosomal protein S12 methylthiotransferase RimO [Muribaculaceae bacterium]|nr:30S ribosomal protein S12 methylthiotransferase RimO [Muribaculaceae bacterium]
MKRVNVISMGCSKNLVDSERLLRRLSDGAIETVHDGEPETPADAVVINTCGFIGDAKEESIDMILRACEAKKDGVVDAVYVMGCLSERYAADLPAEIPEVDGWYGKFDFEDLAARLCRRPAPARAWERRLTTPPWSAYLKIAEGCNRFCAFCAIPLITGRYHSRPVEEILDEVTTLAADGVVEFNVIAQDLSFYGRDLYGEPAIARLVDAMAAVPGVRWIRLHYAYPSDFPYDLLPVMARHANVCKYLDIALQHSSDNMLDRMRRHITGDEQRALLARIRREVPGIHIRTTLMTGFPGETDEDFDDLLRFVRSERFERMGAFAYCEEDDTYAATHYTDDVPEDVKQQRLDRLMAVQEEIALEHNEAKIGRRMTVLVEGDDGEEFYRARSEFDSPEVDPEVLIARDSCATPLVPGTFCEVEITDALPYELIAKAV